MAKKCSNCGECIKKNVADRVQESVSNNGDLDKRKRDGESGLKHGM